MKGSGQLAHHYTLYFLVTLECNLHCKMCLYCGPGRSDNPDPPISTDLVASVLTQLCQLDLDPLSVHVTGGEPTLYPERCKEIVSIISSGDYGEYEQIALSTNSQFATSFDAAHSFLSELKECGLTGLGLSWDEEHYRRKTTDWVINALAAAHDLDFDSVQLDSRGEQNPAAFQWLLDSIEEKYKIKINHAAAAEDRAPFNSDLLRQYQGKGKGSPVVRESGPITSHSHYRCQSRQKRFFVDDLENLKKMRTSPCLRALMVRPDGDLQLCATTAMSAGNVRDESLLDIFARLDKNPLYKLLRRDFGAGISRYAKFLDVIGSKNTGERLCGSLNWVAHCELCLYLFQQYIPKLASNNYVLKLIPEYFSFSKDAFNDIQIPDHISLEDERIQEIISKYRKQLDFSFNYNTSTEYKQDTDLMFKLRKGKRTLMSGFGY